MVAVFGGPLVVLAVYAFSGYWAWESPWPESLDGRAVMFLWRQGGAVTTALASSIGYSLATALAAFAVCVAPAKVFAREEFRGKILLEGLLLAPALVPAMTYSMGVHFAFIRLGLADTWFGVVLVLTIFAYPYMLRALVAGYQALDPEYELCARNLGAGSVRRLLFVELPLLLPAAVAGGSVVFLVAFSEYFLVFLIGGGTVPSFAGYLFPFLGSSDRGVASLLTLVFWLVAMSGFVAVDATVSRAYRKRGMA
jgi:ABC-type spermidine/putrescine transport system permease subunit II